MSIVSSIKDRLFTKKTSASQLVLYDVAGVKVTVCKSEEHRRTSTMTEQTMEDGTVINQHVIQNPIDLVLKFEQCNVLLGKNDIFSKKTTEQLKSWKGENYGEKHARYIWTKIEKIWTERQIVTLLTLHKRYDNMVCVELSALHRAPYRGALEFTAVFRQANFIKKEDRPIPEENVGNKTAVKENKAGSKSPVTIG